MNRETNLGPGAVFEIGEGKYSICKVFFRTELFEDVIY